MSQHPFDSVPSPRDSSGSRRSTPWESRGHRRPIPAYKVILHRDGGSDLMFIVHTVMELTRFCRAEATHKMWQAYHCGRSLLLTTYRERAELYVEQFANKGLTVSIEPA